MNDYPGSSTRLILMRVRLAYAMGLYRSKAFKAGDQPKYGCTCLIPPKHPALDLVEPALLAAAANKWGTKRQKLKGMSTEPVLKSVANFEKLQTGDVDGTWSFVRVASLDPPAIVGPDVEPIAAGELARECYPGRWANVSVNAYAYERVTGNGVTLELNSVQLTKHDKRLGSGRPAPEDDFDPEELPDTDNDDDDLAPARRPRRR